MRIITNVHDDLGPKVLEAMKKAGAKQCLVTGSNASSPDARLFRSIRAKRDITQQTLAKQLGITQGLVSFVETGRAPAGKKLRERAQALAKKIGAEKPSAKQKTPEKQLAERITKGSGKFKKPAASKPAKKLEKKSA